MTLPLSLYIHMPWCIRKCPYCDFNSHKLNGSLNEKEYIDALLRDASQYQSHRDRRIQSIFIGGGTPSLFSDQSFEVLLQGLQKLFRFSDEIEITLEANPGSVEQKRFSGYRKAGINRLSLGIQSFDDNMLKGLGRIHDGSQAKVAIETAQRSGFDNFNVDLMYGLPNQTPKGALTDISLALEFSPAHLSWYQLTIEPNTIFYTKTPVLPDERTLAEMENLAADALSNYNRYEISAYCRKNCHSRHNLNYWLFGDYLGIGAGAHGKISVNQQIWRHKKRRVPKDYLANQEEIKGNPLNKSEIIFDFMLNCTRLYQPIAKSLFSDRCFMPYSVLAPQVEQLISRGLMADSDAHFWLTPLGKRFVNDIQQFFLP
jgi:putative oxygen-independent coproporphyrinogen III oxidase